MDRTNENRPKPLFASAAGAIPNEVEETESSQKTSNDLENFNVSLAASTLDAILAVQQAGPPKSLGSVNTASVSKDNQTRLSLCENEEREQSISSDDEVYTYDRKRKRSKEKRKHKKKKKHKHNKHQSPSPVLERRKSHNPISEFHRDKVFIDDIPNLQPEDAFHVDRKANKDLKRYQSISKRHISKYKLACTSCIGNTDIRVDHQLLDRNNIPEDVSKNKRKRFQKNRYFGKDNVKQLWRSGFALNVDSSSSKVLNQPEYIVVSKKGEEENKNNNSGGGYNCLDEATSLYVQGKGKLLTFDSQSMNDFVMDEFFNKVARYNQRTREEPHNIELWLEFVKFQDVVAMEDKSFRKQTLHLYDIYRPSKSVIEKKLSILEKAIQLNPSDLSLKQTQLELYQDIWETEKVEKSWEDLLFVHASNVDLWRHYLSRQQSRLSTFSFNKVVKKYHKCFQTLIPILEGQVKVISKSEHLEEKLLGVFCQYCSFLHQSGYTERAVASFQAMIEFNLFCPPSLNLTPTKERLEKFEAFWECPVPKFGDLNARGWTEEERKKEKNKSNVGFLPESTEKEEDAILSSGLPKSLTWLKMEKARQDVYWLPWKPDEANGETEERCEDPDRLVLFEDISPSLFRLTKSHGCVQLVCLFLSFLGMNSDRMESVLEDVVKLEKSEFTGLFLDQMQQIPAVTSLNPGIDVGLLWKPHLSLVEFIRQVILQAENYFSSSSHRELFTLLRVDLELKKSGTSNIQTFSAGICKEIKKFGKNILKESQNRNNLVMWDTYIRLLWVLSDKMEETVSMIDVALGMFLGSNSLSDLTKAKGICLLCRTFAEVMLNFEPLEHVKLKGRHTAPSVEDKQQVIGCMGALVEGKKFKPHTKVDSSPLYILRTRKRMEKVLETFMSSLDGDSLSLSTCETINVFTQCHVLFEFSASNLQSAHELFVATKCQIRDRLKDNFKMRDSLLKHLHKSHMSFISNVMHIQCVPLSKLRCVLNEALTDFPDNSYFHKTFLGIEAGSFLAGRLRKFYDKQLKSSPSVSSVMFAVFSELGRLDTVNQEDIPLSDILDTGLVHRIRSLFEHTLELPVCSNCPLLWRMWLAYEMHHGTKTRAKGILYRALQSCPWAKIIYMDGVEYFGDEELNEMCDLMTEKEIRVCMPLEEMDLLLNAEKESK